MRLPCYYILRLQNTPKALTHLNISHTAKTLCLKLENTRSLWNILIEPAKLHNITKLLKRSRRENTANEPHETGNIEDEQQTEQEAIVEQLEESPYRVVTEASSTSVLNPQP